jgi:3',5'-cyclic AMP phosphodiesterase CpdA
MAGTSPAMTDEMFTLAHLSDPHLAPMPVPNFARLRFKQFAGYVNWLRSRQFIHRTSVLAKITADIAKKPDHIAVSGDIANIALPFEFVRGRDWLSALGTAEDVSTIPGNHDIYVSGAETLARQYWGAHMRGDAGESIFPYVRRRGPLALIGLCSGVPTELFFASGRLGADQLARLATTLDQLKTDRVFRVVMIHHPPVSKSSWRKRLVDADELMRVIAAHGAELLIHGHDHLHMLNSLRGPDGTRVPSASSAPGKGKADAAYNLYRVEGTAGVWACEMISRGIEPAGDIVELKRVKLIG